MTLSSLLVFLASLLSALLAVGLAAFVLSRNPRARANRWLALGLLAVGAYQAALLVSSLAESAEWRLRLFQLALAVLATIPPSWLGFGLTFGEVNGGSRLASWRPVLLGLAGAVPLAWLALLAGRLVQPVPLGNTGIVLVGLDLWGKLFFSYYLIALALVLFHLENLYRHADRIVRWKIKFLIVGVFAAFAFQIVAGSFALLYGFIHPLSPSLGALAFLVGEGMIAFSLVRHRLLDVDIFVSRYVVYRSLTLLLVGGYLVSLGVLAEIFRQLNITLDLVSGTFLAILGAVALSLLLLSENVRRRVQRSIHTHFYKHKYDYRVEWMEYTRRLSKATAVPEIARQTLNRILEVMWVRQAALYAAGDSPRQMVLAHQVGYEALPAALELSGESVRALQETARLLASAPAEPDEPAVTPVELVRRLVGEVPVGCLVPVAALDSLVGLLVVGPERSGKPFGVDDRDLLVAVAAQAGALLVNARLSQEAMEGREFQALARVSAFVVHDLKNTVSMLAMLAENAKLHMAKPEFQADALRTLGQAVSRMRALMAALSAPGDRRPDGLQPVALDACVAGWLRELGGQIPSRIRVETRLTGEATVLANPEQLHAVLRNLTLNAVEATPGEGLLRIETARMEGDVLLTVADTGRGISGEFLERKLFRPFQTTKPRGLGIGLYQCRHIVQGFGGTLTAESEEGRGTRMIVRLPVAVVEPQGGAPDATPRPVDTERLAAQSGRV